MSRPGELSGRLRERIAILRRDEARDALGGADGGWRAMGDAWAAIEPAGTGAPVAGEAIRARPRWRVTVRAGAGLMPGDRIRWRGAVLRVRQATADPRLPDRILAEAEEEP